VLPAEHLTRALGGADHGGVWPPGHRAPSNSGVWLDRADLKIQLEAKFMISRKWRTPRRPGGAQVLGGSRQSMAQRQGLRGWQELLPDPGVMGTNVPEAGHQSTRPKLVQPMAYWGKSWVQPRSATAIGLHSWWY